MIGRNFFKWVNEFEKFSVGCIAVKLVSFVADSVTFSAFHGMAVIIEHFFERAFVNNRLLAVQGGALFTLEGFDGHAFEFDSLNGLPRLFIKLQNLNSIKSGLFKCPEKLIFTESSRDASAPQFGILHHFFAWGLP